MSEGNIEKRLDRIDQHIEASRRKFREFLRARDEKVDAYIEEERRAIAQLRERTDTTEDFVREMIIRMDRAGQRRDALTECMIGLLDAGTRAIWKALDRLGEAPKPAS